MSTPVYEEEQYSFPTFQADPPANQHHHHRSLDEDEDGTLQDGAFDGATDNNHLRVTTSYAEGSDYINKDYRNMSPMSPSMIRDESQRLEDELEMARAERMVSNAQMSESDMSRSKSLARSRSRTNAEPVDDFDIGTTPIHEKTKIYQPPSNPSTKFAKLFRRVHNSSFLVRYITYIMPITLILLIPLLLGAFVFPQAAVGGVFLQWFMLWLEIIWLTLWAGRVRQNTMNPLITCSRVC